MMFMIGTRFPESPIPSRVLIAIGPGAPPRGQLQRGDTAQGVVACGDRVPWEGPGRNGGRGYPTRLGSAAARARPMGGGVEARLAEAIATCDRAHRPAGRGARRAAPAA